MYTIYVNNMLPPALAVHEIFRDIFGPPMIEHVQKIDIIYFDKGNGDSRG